MGQQRRDIARESETAEHLEVGPGVLAGGAALWPSPIVFAVAGAVALGVFGGYAKSQDTRETNRVDV